ENRFSSNDTRRSVSLWSLISFTAGFIAQRLKSGYKAKFSFRFPFSSNPTASLRDSIKIIFIKSCANWRRTNVSRRAGSGHSGSPTRLSVFYFPIFRTRSLRQPTQHAARGDRAALPAPGARSFLQPTQHAARGDRPALPSPRARSLRQPTEHAARGNRP